MQFSEYLQDVQHIELAYYNLTTISNPRCIEIGQGTHVLYPNFDLVLCTEVRSDQNRGFFYPGAGVLSIDEQKLVAYSSFNSPDGLPDFFIRLEKYIPWLTNRTGIDFN